jgi:hypothetical protein
MLEPNRYNQNRGDQDARKTLQNLEPRAKYHPMNLQRIQNTTIHNITWFGRHLQRLLEQEAAAEIIAPYGTFQQGGCLVLARALVALEPSLGLWVVVRVDGVTDHVVAGTGKLFLDGDGMATELDLLHKMRLIESVDAREVRPLEERLLHPEIQSDPETEQKLVAWLRPRLRIKWLKINEREAVTN